MKDKFQESLIILSVLKHTMEKDYAVLQRYHDDYDLRFSITNKMLIDISSFFKRMEKVQKILKRYPRD